MLVMLLVYVPIFGMPIAVYRDAKHIGVRSGLLPGLLGWGPVGWAVLSLFLNIIAVPIYTWMARPRLIEKIRQLDLVQPLPAGQVRGTPSSTFPKLIGGFLLLLLVLMGAAQVAGRSLRGSEAGAAGASASSLGGHITIGPSSGGELVVSANYKFLNDINADGEKILSDTYRIAKMYPQAKVLKLTVFFVGQNKYGETQKQEVGVYTVQNLDDVRRYQGEFTYTQSEDPKWSLAAFLNSPGSPYSR